LDSLVFNLITTAIGVTGAIFGFITYAKNQTLKRQEIIIPLMKDFDTNDKLKTALDLLDDYIVEVTGPISREFGRDNLKTILRDHKILKVNDPAEIAIRESFTALLDFFGKLGYLMDIMTITRTELGYFEYYINKAKSDPSIVNYAQTYEFELFAVLLEKIDSLPNTLKPLAAAYHKRNKKPRFR
jgi:hypothetical protein